MTALMMQSFGQGMPLVLFHGWGFDSRIWTPWHKALATLPYRYILVDLPGFGQSPCMSWVTFKQQLLRQIPGQFAVLGWSLGGLFATRLALELPEHITHVLNLTSSPCFVRHAAWPGLRSLWLDAFYQAVETRPQLSHQAFVTEQIKTSGCWTNNALNVRGLLEGLEVLQSWDLRSHLQDLIPPIVYVFGTLDTIVPIKIMPLMLKMYPHFTYYGIDEAGHVPFLSHPQRLLHILERFLS